MYTSVFQIKPVGRSHDFKSSGNPYPKSTNYQLAIVWILVNNKLDLCVHDVKITLTKTDFKINVVCKKLLCKFKS